MKSIYLIGALKNWEIPQIANEIQALGIEAFCDWISPGPDADKYLLQLAKARGWNYEQLLNSHAANHCFQFDKENLNRVDAAVAIAPFGKSAFAELGYMAGKGKPVFVLFPNGPELPERFDLMIKFATKVFFDKESFYAELKKRFISPSIFFDPAIIDSLRRSEPFWRYPYLELPVRSEVNRTFFQYKNLPKRCAQTYKWAFGGVSQCQLDEGHKPDNDSSGHKFSVQEAK